MTITPKRRAALPRPSTRPRRQNLAPDALTRKHETDLGIHVRQWIYQGRYNIAEVFRMAFERLTRQDRGLTDLDVIRVVQFEYACAQQPGSLAEEVFHMAKQAGWPKTARDAYLGLLWHFRRLGPVAQGFTFYAPYEKIAALGHVNPKTMKDALMFLQTHGRLRQHPGARSPKHPSRLLTKVTLTEQSVDLLRRWSGSPL